MPLQHLGVREVGPQRLVEDELPVRAASGRSWTKICCPQHSLTAGGAEALWRLPPPPRARTKLLSSSPWTARTFDSPGLSKFEDASMTSFLAAFAASAWDTKSQRSALVAGRPPPAEQRQFGRVAPKVSNSQIAEGSACLAVAQIQIVEGSACLAVAQ